MISLIDLEAIRNYQKLSENDLADQNLIEMV